MKIEAVLKSINAAISCVESAKYYSQHDMPEDAEAKCGEAIGYLSSTKMHLELENGSFGKENVHVQ